MISANQNMIEKFASNPKKLFLVDGFGALLTAVLLLTVLSRFEDHFGMPRNVVYFLSAVAFAFAIYSFCCSVFVSRNWSNYLKIISIANITYCCLTFGLILYFFQKLTILGLVYFLLEIVVISCLVVLEFKVISAMKNGNRI